MSIVSLMSLRHPLRALVAKAWLRLPAGFAWACTFAVLALLLPPAGHAGNASTFDALPSQAIDGARWQSAAHAALSTWLQAHGYRFEIESPANGAPLRVPSGRVELVARPLPLGLPLTERMQVWVDVLVDGHFARTQPVTLHVRAYGNAWVAADDMAAGRDVKTAPFENREVDIAALRTTPVDGELPSTRLRKRLLKGEVLSASHLEPQLAVSRGSSVTLRTRLGDIGVESRGEALQDGQPGQRIWVKVATSTGPVLAQVVGAGLVETQP